MSIERITKLQCDWCGEYQEFISKRTFKYARQFAAIYTKWIFKKEGLLRIKELDFCSQECLNNHNLDNQKQ